MDQLHNSFINAARRRVKVEQDKCADKIRREILACKHQEIGESDSRRGHRICLHCGLAEEGWSFPNLGHEKHPRKVSYEEVLKLRTVHLLEGDHGDKRAFQRDPKAWLDDPSNERWLK